MWSYAGLTTPNTGATHQAVDDVNIMRGIPNMIVMKAADAFELEQAMEACLLYDGPTYLRIVRCAVDRVVPEEYQFEIGKSCVLKDGKDVTILGSGLTVSLCLQAADLLERESISAEVINVSTIKPIDTETIVKSAARTGHVLTEENHSVFGGLGSTTAEVLSENYPVPLKRIGIDDRFGTSGQLDTILKDYGLTAKNIVENSVGLLNKEE